MWSWATDNEPRCGVLSTDQLADIAFYNHRIFAGAYGVHSVLASNGDKQYTDYRTRKLTAHRPLFTGREGCTYNLTPKLSPQNLSSRPGGASTPRWLRLSCLQLHSVEGVAPTNHSPSQKTRINVLSYDIKNLNTAFFRFVTIHAFDGRTDRQTDRRTDRIPIARPRLHSMQRGNNNNNNYYYYFTAYCSHESNWLYIKQKKIWIYKCQY